MWQFLFCKLSMKIYILRTFWPSKLKEGQFLAKKKVKKSVFFDFFLIESKSIENEKILFPQMIKVYQKKFPPFKRKKRFLAILWFFQNQVLWNLKNCKSSCLQLKQLWTAVGVIFHIKSSCGSWGQLWEAVGSCGQIQYCIAMSFLGNFWR